MQREAKNQPTRDDLAAMWKTIRDQSQIIKMQADKIRTLERVIGRVLLNYPRNEELRVVDRRKAFSLLILKNEQGRDCKVSQSWVRCVWRSPSASRARRWKRDGPSFLAERFALRRQFSSKRMAQLVS